MTKFVHIVQVHPVYNGIVQTHKVKHEAEAETKEEAEAFIKWYNTEQCTDGTMMAVYLGCVNDETGELV
jgi:ferritin